MKKIKKGRLIMSDDELKTLKESIEFVKNLDLFNKNNEKQNNRIKKLKKVA